MSSWTEAMPPPGWLVSRLARNHEHPDRVWWARCAGTAKYGQTREAACRLAWERWALGVLGDRVDWIRYPSLKPAVVNVRSSARSARIVVVHAPAGIEYDLQADVTDPDDDGALVWTSWTSVDPVEALARLASQTLAVLGPQTMDGTPKGQGGER